MGTLCILDKKPRQLTETQKEIIQYLADIIIDQIELRLAARVAIYQKNQLLTIAVHDLKNPLTTIPLWADLIKDTKNDGDEVDKMCDRINNASSKMTNIINELPELCRYHRSGASRNFT